MFKSAKCPSVLVLTCIFLVSSSPARASDDGSFMRTLIPAVAYGTTFYMHDHDGRNQFYASFFTNLGATYALKATISKERPNGTDDKSFPSGHTSVAFQGAAFIHKRYGLKYAVAAYVGATYVGWRRVATDNHYTVDVVAGAAIGIASSFIFTKPYKGFEVTPLADNGVYGLAISKHW
ncbi:MAG: phosphatase PAP2 family protein [Lysobacterales bacterium]